MCNPRRVHVTATRELSEAWEHEVRRVVRRTASALGEARIREPLDGGIGAPVLRMLERVLAGAEGWQRVDDTFRYPLDGGYLAYHLDARELEIVAQVVDAVDVEASESTVVSGELRETLEAGGSGQYYDDGWGGYTEEWARQAARRDAQRNLAARRREVLDKARSDAEARDAAAVEARASARAEAELARRTESRAEQLRADAARRLTALGIQGRNVFHQALALAYRDAVLAYARHRGADRISCVERDGVLEIEFELQA